MTQTFERQDIGYLLTAYADGQLAPDGVMWVEEQLDRNPDLRARLKEIRNLQAGLRAAFAGGAPDFVLDLPRREALLVSAANPPRKKLLFPAAPLWIGLAASVMAIVYVGMQTLGSPHGRSETLAVHNQFTDDRDQDVQGQTGLKRGFVDKDRVGSRYNYNGSAEEMKKLGEGNEVLVNGDHEDENSARLDSTREVSKFAPESSTATSGGFAGEADLPRRARSAQTGLTPSEVAPPAARRPSAPPRPAIMPPMPPEIADAPAGVPAANSPVLAMTPKPKAEANQLAAEGKTYSWDSRSGKEADQRLRSAKKKGKEITKEQVLAESAKGSEEAVAPSDPTASGGAFMALGTREKKSDHVRGPNTSTVVVAQGSSPGQQFRQVLESDALEEVATGDERLLERHEAERALAKGGNSEKTNTIQVAEAVGLQLKNKLAEVEEKLDGQTTLARSEQESAQLAVLKERHPDIAVELRDKKKALAELQEGYTEFFNEISDEKASAAFLQAVVGAVRNNPQGQQDLLMLTLGKGDQVENGTEFIIFRGNDYIVRVRAEKTVGDMVACRIIHDSWNSRGLQIQQGDLAQNRLGGGDGEATIAARSFARSSAIDPQQSLAALRAPVTLDGTLGLAQSLRLIGGDKIGYSLTTGAQGLVERQVQVSLRDEPAARGVLRAVRSAGLQAQFTGGMVHLDAATRPLDPADTQGYDLPTFKELFGTSPMQVTAVDAVQTVAIDADTASYEYAKARVASGQSVDPATIKPEHFINAMPMDYPAAQGPEAFTLYAEAAPSPFARAGTTWGPRTALVSIGAVAKPAAANERKPLALTLAIDCSGSMAQEGGLDRIKHGLFAFVEHLRAEDRVSIVAFGDQARVVLPATPGNDRAALTNALENLATGGATNAAEGLGLAYQLAAETAAVGVESRVLLATDGGTVAGADDLLRRVTAFKDRGITLVVVGTGQTYRAGPLQELATKGDGQHFYVGSDEDAEELFTGKLLPDRIAVLAKDAKLQVTWNPQRVSHARLIGYDQRRLAAKDFRDNSVDAGELSQDTQVTALFEVLLVDGGAGPLGTAAVRYQDMRREQVRELACPLPGTILHSQASDRLRLLACAAATAEWLQRGWWSNVHLITPQEILSQLARCPQPIADELRAMVK